MTQLRSMTGFGMAEKTNQRFKIKVEIRALNGKFLETNLRISRFFKDRETQIRQLINQTIVRGSVQVSVAAEVLDPSILGGLLEFDARLAQDYKNKILSFCNQTQIEPNNWFEYITGLPEVVTHREVQSDEQDFALLSEVYNEAFLALDSFRITEGKSLRNELHGLAQNIEKNLAKVMELEPERKNHIKSRVAKALDDIQEKTAPDPARFEYELLYYLEKLDIREEVSRLQNHITFFYNTLDQTNMNGKKLGFISQEMGREINTLGSKASYFEMQKWVVEMKEQLEKIKEQCLNVL